MPSHGRGRQFETATAHQINVCNDIGFDVRILQFFLRCCVSCTSFLRSLYPIRLTLRDEIPEGRFSVLPHESDARIRCFFLARCRLKE